MMNRKRFGRDQSWPNFKVLSQHSPEGTEEDHENPQDSRSPVRYLNPGPLDYDTGVLTWSHVGNVLLILKLGTRWRRVIIFMSH
jgi:hypothetical protein